MRARNHNPARLLLLVVMMVVCVPGAVLAQSWDNWDGRRLHATRESLEELLASFEQAAASSAYSQELRSQARSEAELVRARLEQGDFRAGDQITLSVADEPALEQTYTVQPGPMLLLPGMIEIPLHGVLRSELDDHIARELSRYIRNPTVRASSTIRITLTGEVGQPGFIVVESGMLLTDVFGTAGGLTRSADLKRIRIERGQDRIWEGDSLQQAIIEGRTLDQLSLRAGDRIVVPSQRQGMLGTWALRIISPGFVYLLIRRWL